jgi:hypothetical protein
MPDVESLITSFAERGIRFTLDGADLLARPPAMLTDADRATIRKHKAALLACFTHGKTQVPVNSAETIGSQFIAPAVPLAAGEVKTPSAALEFPLCSGCGQRRYWLGTQGKVACSVCGVVRFEITHLEFRSVP